ncbi:Glycosyltransferase [Oenococcus oeni]|uniref:glycosyltransferase family 2 protein n=1 Tax=Oenococcus oeni TaxID=1247 RepID=UPI0010B2D6C8|nr:glycosyltransferase [Oenococcus oeni]SYW12244.1 Glycosyltransferase [Oenococcus oeni]
MIVFVILNFLTFEDTEKQVSYILKDLSGPKRVVVVDNGSPNESGKSLSEKFIHHPDVDVILNTENVGYAQGNNIGYKKALQYHPDFVVVLNNDVELTQRDFIHLVETSFKKTHFACMGPDVFVPELQWHQNPKKEDNYSIQEVLEINHQEKKLLDNAFLLRIHVYLKRFAWIKKIVKRSANHNSLNFSRERTNVVLHGSIIIFSKLFFDAFSEPFNHNTFLYFETEILNEEIRRKGLIASYDPSIKALHHQNLSTKRAFNNEYDKTVFQIKNMIASTQVFLDKYQSGVNKV